MQVLGIIGEAGGAPDVLEALALRLEDEDRTVQNSAAQVLGSIAEKGDRQTIGALLLRPEDAEAKVWKSVVQAFMSIGEAGDRESSRPSELGMKTKSSA